MSRSPEPYFPLPKPVNDLLDEYMSIYGVNTWAMSTYESRKSLIATYIRPSSVIGSWRMSRRESWTSITEICFLSKRFLLSM